MAKFGVYEIAEELHHVFWEGEDYEFPSGRHQPKNPQEQAALEHLCRSADWMHEDDARTLATLVEEPLDDAPSSTDGTGTFPFGPGVSNPATDAGGIDLAGLDALAAQAQKLDDQVLGSDT